MDEKEKRALEIASKFGSSNDSFYRGILAGVMIGVIGFYILLKVVEYLFG
jgi:hypothetical protein